MEAQSTPKSADGSIKVTRRTDKSLLMSITHAVIRPIRPRLARPKSVSPRGSQKLTPHRKATRHCNVHERQIYDIWVYDITRKETNGTAGGGDVGKEKSPGAEEAGRRKRVVYFAGGGWQTPPSSGHWALMADMVNKVPGLTVTLVAYPLAPSSPAASAMPMLRKMYDTLMEESIAEGREKVIMAGDSSGGNIAICLVTWALTHPNDSTSIAPAAILAISPSTDLRHIHSKLDQIEKLDPLLTVSFINSTARAWCGQSSSDTDDTDLTPKSETGLSDYKEWSDADPRVSPILADLEPLVRHGVRLYCVTGTHDVLSVETHAFRDKCNKAGVVGEWLEWDRQMHCFPLASAYGLRESKEGVDWMVDALRKI